VKIYRDILEIEIFRDIIDLWCIETRRRWLRRSSTCLFVWWCRLHRHVSDSDKSKVRDADVTITTLPVADVKF